PLAEVEGRLDRIGEPGAGGAADDRAVDHDLDLVLAAMGKGRGLVEIDGPAVHADAGEAGGPQLVPEGVVALAVPALDGGHDVDAGSLGEMQDFFDDLVGRLAADREVALGAIELAEAGEENSQVVVDLGDGADGGAGAL